MVKKSRDRLVCSFQASGGKTLLRMQQLGSGHFTNSCELRKYLASVQVAYMGSLLCRSIHFPLSVQDIV